LINDYKLLSRDLTVEWLYPYVSELNANLVKEGKESYVISKERIRAELDMASADIDIGASLLGAAINSKDPITALVAKAIKHAMFNSQNDDRAVLENLFEAYEEAKPENHSKYLQDIEFEEKSKDSEGKVITTKVNRKAIITKLRYDLYDKNKSEFSQKMGQRPTDEKLSKEWGKKWAIWLSINTQVKPETNSIVANKKKNLSDTQYKMWLSSNTRAIDNVMYFTGETTYDMIKLNNPESISHIDGNKIYIYSGELIEPSEKIYYNNNYDLVKDDKYYQTLIKQYNEANEQLPVNQRLRYGLAPQVPKESIDKSLGERFSKESMSALFNVKAYDTKYGVRTLSGELYRKVPVLYTTPLPEGIASENLLESILKFSQMSNNYKNMSKIKANVEVLMDIVSERSVAETNAKGEQKRDAVTNAIITKSASEAKKVNERIKAFVDMSFYAENEKLLTFDINGKEYDMNKITGKLQYLTAVSSMALNVTSGISNRLWGNYQAFATSIAGKDYTTKEWLEARKDYTLNIPRYLNDVGLVIGKSKESQLVDYFDAIQGEFKDNYGNRVGGSAARRLFSTNTLFFINNATEHQIQTTTFLAILKHYKVKNEAGDSVSLYDAYNVINGKLKLKEGFKFTDNNRFELMNRIHALNKRMHGVYNEFDKGELQRMWYGKMALMFRKHIYSGMIHRWGKEKIDIEGGDITEGYYRTFASKLYDDIKKYGAIGLLKYKTYTPEQKQAFAKTMLDISMLSGAILVGAAIAGSDDDDDDRRSWFQNETLLQLRRFESDIKFYTVLNSDFFRVLLRPTVVEGTVENILKLTWQLGDPTEQFKRKTGIFDKGDYKIEARFYKAMPLLRQVILTLSPEEQLKIFNR
jgi:hypothetical protein